VTPSAPGVRLRFDPDDPRTALAAWSRLAEPGDEAAADLIRRMGPSRALRAVAEGTAGSPRWSVRLPHLDPMRDLTTVRTFGGRVVIPGDEEWPSGLAALAGAQPFCLWVRGPLSPAVAAERSVALVGARACTNYGHEVALTLGGGCADRGISVVSGAAFGVDGAAHRGALAVGGATIAVLAGGVERPYPRGHDSLITRIAQVGCVVSEVPPGSAPTRWRFIERNRLIAALSRLTVVVEAARRSGALSTASRAAAIGRVVAAVPGPVTSAMSYGCHWLLRERDAVCVTSAEEIAELVSPIGTDLPEPPPYPRAEHDGLPPDAIRVLDAVPLRRPAELESIARSAGLPIATVSAAMGRLDARGLVTRQPAGWQRSPTRRLPAQSDSEQEPNG
jgi:DNA processing protein